MRHSTYKMTAIMVVMFAFMFGKTYAKEVQVPKMYIFGFAASFNDTIVHFTNVMDMDSVWIESKNKFLLGRQLYSRQLRDYLSDKKQLPQRTCVVMFGTNRSKLEKKMLKMRKLYLKSKDGQQHYDVRFLDDTEFHFRALSHDEVIVYEAQPEGEQEEAAPNPKKKKKEKKGKK